jgi:transcription initiation factor TFIID subunit 9B
LAEKKNMIALPLVPEKFGLRLPPERHCLLKPNITIVPKKRPIGDMQVDTPYSAPQTARSHIISPQQQQQPLFLPQPTVMPTMQLPKTKPKVVEEDDYDMDGKNIFLY